MTTSAPSGQPATEQQALVAHISSPLGTTAGIITEQASMATVSVDSVTMLDLQVVATGEVPFRSAAVVAHSPAAATASSSSPSPL
jgi:hypothetical protein